MKPSIIKKIEESDIERKGDPRLRAAKLLEKD
jgi:hypothetical protein